MRDIERLPEEIEVRMAPALCPLNVSPYDFSQAESLISRATLSTRRWIEQGGLTRPASPRQLAPHHHQHAGHPATHSM
ncbi:hypothetical protein WOB59_10575 [Methylocystis sp. IM4]